MAIVRPFKAVRPEQDLVEKVACPPYDVLSYDEAKKWGEIPESFMRVIRAEIDLSEGEDHYGKPVYEKARNNLQEMLDNGTMIQEKSPVYFIYRQKMGEHTQIGVVGCSSVDEYQAGLIKKHELTRQDKEDDRANHVFTVGANTGPVFLTFEAFKDFDKALSELTAKLDHFCNFTDENNISHELFPVRENSDIEKLEKLFERIPTMYIADGHHRAASASRVRELMKKNNSQHNGTEEYNFFMSVIFPHNQLKVLDYNRVVKDLNQLSKEAFIEAIKEKFDIEVSEVTPARPGHSHEFGMYLDGKWYLLEAKKESFDNNDPVKSLDVSILQENLLSPVLGIDDPRKDPRIDFIGGIRGLKALETKVDNGWAVAFSMYPTSIEELMNVADDGKTMPPKSTWFEPKLRSGLFVHLLK